MAKPTIAEVLAKLDREIQEIEESLASKRATKAELEKYTNILGLDVFTKPSKGPKKRRKRKKGNTPTDAVREYFEKNPGKNITTSEVVRALVEQGFTKDKHLGPNVNTALRRFEKDGKLKRRKITPKMKVYNPSGKAEFAYRYLKPVSSGN